MIDNVLDLYVGTRIKMKRMEIGMTEEELGKSVKFSVKKIKKYEAGEETVYVSDMFYFANAMDVSMKYFVRDIDEVFKIFKDNNFDLQKDADKIVKIIYSLEKFR